jgi:hypothetical protein
MHDSRLVAALKQRMNGRTLTATARELGVSKQLLSNVLHGRGVSPLFAARCLRRWPTLADDYLADLAAELAEAERERAEAVA